MDRRTDQGMDTPSYRDARTHLKRRKQNSHLDICNKKLALCNLGLSISLLVGFTFSMPTAFTAPIKIITTPTKLITVPAQSSAAGAAVYMALSSSLLILLLPFKSSL